MKWYHGGGGVITFVVVVILSMIRNIYIKALVSNKKNIPRPK